MSEQLLVSEVAHAIAGADWAELGRRHWNRTPAKLRCWPGAPPLEEERLFAAAVAASGPFRSGMRSVSLTDARFFVPGARIAAPGDLLPHPGDRSMAGYERRLATRLAGEGYLLRVVQPLRLDFQLWSQVRNLLRGLWDQVGFPVLPLVVEAMLGHRLTDRIGLTATPSHAVLVCVLRGTVRVWLRDDRTGVPVADTDPDRTVPDQPTLVGTAGDLLYWPAAYRHMASYNGPCLALRVLVPAAGRLPVAAIPELVATLMQSRRGRDDRTPYLPYPAPAGPDGATGGVQELAVAAEQLHELASGPELARLLRVRWAARVSAHGLEPVPEPRPDGSLTPEQHVRLSDEIVQVPDGRGRSIWAVNGHLLAVRGTAATRVLRRLRDGETEVARLYREAGSGETAGGGAARVLALLQRLYGLRGIELVRDGEV